MMILKKCLTLMDSVSHSHVVVLFAPTTIIKIVIFLFVARVSRNFVHICKYKNIPQTKVVNYAAFI